MNSPILFLVFNRIEETMQSFDAIRKARPKKLYVAADGPRKHMLGESNLCDSVRQIATNVDWDCELFTLFRDDNLGCRKAIVGAINWFFDNEEQGIILEDDVIPIQEFFTFCDDLLNRYRYNKNIIAVNGFNQFGQEVMSNSYFFSRGFYPWGWATWKSRWSNYKDQNINLSRLNDTDIRETYDKATIEGVKFNLNIINKGILDTWDYQMLFLIMDQKGFVITPFANLTTNIGVNGAHSINNQNIFFKYGEISINSLEHPDDIRENSIMNQKLRQEYKQAYNLVKIKSFLFKTNMYLPLRQLYKTLKRKYLLFSKY